MGGPEARDGFWFQDARALVRLLADAVTRRARKLASEPVPNPIRIKIEATVVEGSQPSARQSLKWDSVTFEDDLTIVDESKSGEITRDERITLYQRIRATCASRGTAENLVPRVTTAPGAQANPDKWCELASASATVEPPEFPPKPVGDAQQLAGEAMYFLTSPNFLNDASEVVEAKSPPLKIEEARAVMGAFRFDDQFDLLAVEAELERLLGVLGAEISVEQAVNFLRGWIAKKAVQRPGGAELTCDSIAAELSLVARYLTVDPEAERLWLELANARPPSIDSLVPHLELSQSQPQVLAAAESAPIHAIALVGGGGIGKSYALSQCYSGLSGRRVWIDAATEIVNLEDALCLAAWLATQRNERLILCLDGLDQASDPAKVLAIVDRATGGHDVLAIAALRPNRWAAISKSAPRWRETKLERWSRESVAASLRHVHEEIPADLLDLLRTPLLLDLYLRTIGSVPDTSTFRPTNRHELVAEYFARRILPNECASASRRRELITNLGDQVARGNLRWTITGDQEKLASDLIGEGLLVSSFGRFRFRHALLQDVCVAMALSAPKAADCARAVERVESLTLRHDAIRALMEAALARGTAREFMDLPPATALVSELMAANLPAADSAGDVVVDMEDANVLLASGLPAADMIRWARAADNKSWLLAIACLPLSPTPGWLQTGNFEENLAAIARNIATPGIPESTSRALAERLRAWGQKRLQTSGWPFIEIVGAVLRWSPTKETLTWLDSLPSWPAPEYCDLFRHMRKIAALDPSLDDDLIARLVLRAFEVMSGGPLPQHAHRDRALDEVAMYCFQNGDKEPSLFDSKPRAAYRVLFELVARDAEAQRLENEEQRRDPAYKQMLAEIDRAFAAELAQHPEQHSESSTPSAVDTCEEPGIVEDVPLFGWSPEIYPLHAAWVNGANRLSDPTVAAIAFSEAERSRSRAARNLVRGKDADLHQHMGGAWLESEVPSDERVRPSDIPESVWRAWSLLEQLVLSYGKGFRSSYVARGTLAAVLSRDSLERIPGWALHWVSFVVNNYRDSLSPELRSKWSNDLFDWIEYASPVGELAIDAWEALDELRAGIHSAADVALVVRIAKGFVTQLQRTPDAKKGKLFGAACHLMSADAITRNAMVDFASSHPEGGIVAGALRAFVSAPVGTFVSIARELFEQSDKTLPREPLEVMARQLGVLSCHPKTAPEAWPTVHAWLNARPTRGPLLDSASWREFIEALGNGAMQCGSLNPEGYVEISSSLWRAWCAAPDAGVHGLVWTLFFPTHGVDNPSRALVAGLAALACEVIARGSGYDLMGLKEVPWPLLPAHSFDTVVSALGHRISCGPPDLDEHGGISASLDALVKVIADCQLLTPSQADALYGVVQPAKWLLHREARCHELLARTRTPAAS